MMQTYDVRSRNTETQARAPVITQQFKKRTLITSINMRVVFVHRKSHTATLREFLYVQSVIK